VGNARVKVIKGSSIRLPISKATTSTVQSNEGITDIIEPPYSIRELRQMKEQSTILAQCIEAYALNIVGFGYSLQYLNLKLRISFLKPPLYCLKLLKFKLIVKLGILTRKLNAKYPI
jgi:hypothetical protein